MLFAQEGGLPKYGIKDFNPEYWYSVNPATLESVTNFDADEAFGFKKNTHLFGIQTAYMTARIDKGKRSGNSTFFIDLFDRGPLFAGEGYWNFQGYLPVNPDFAKEFNVAGGWKYNLTNYVAIDIGGNFTFTDKKVNADGRPAMHQGEGEDIFGDIYFGFIGNCFLEPFAYVLYDFTFYQTELRLGFAPKVDLKPYTRIEGLGLEFIAYGAYTMTDRFSGKNNGATWKNSYAYFYGRADIVWVYEESLKFAAGIGYSYNTDGSGFAGPYNSDLGPDSNVFFRCSIGYSF